MYIYTYIYIYIHIVIRGSFDHMDDSAGSCDWCIRGIVWLKQLHNHAIEVFCILCDSSFRASNMAFSLVRLFAQIEVQSSSRWCSTAQTMWLKQLRNHVIEAFRDSCDWSFLRWRVLIVGSAKSCYHVIKAPCDQSFPVVYDIYIYIYSGYYSSI